MGTTLFTGQASVVSEIKQLIGLADDWPGLVYQLALVLVLALAILLPLTPAPAAPWVRAG